MPQQIKTMLFIMMCLACDGIPGSQQDSSNVRKESASPEASPEEVDTDPSADTDQTPKLEDSEPIPEVKMPGAFQLLGIPSGTWPRSKLTLSWTNSADAETIEIVIGRNSGCSELVSKKTSNVSATSLMFESLGEGSYFVCASALDASGGSKTASNSNAPLVVGPVVVMAPNFTRDESPDPSETNATGGVEGAFATEDQLIVTDMMYGRVLIWNQIPTQNGTPADLIIKGDTWGGGALALSEPSAAITDGTRFLICDGDNNRVLIWNTMPTDANAPPDLVLGQPNLTMRSPNHGGRSLSSLNYPYGAAIFENKLFVIDYSNNRVLIWNEFPTANHQAADVVVGQPDDASGGANTGGLSASSLYSPNGVSFNASGLWITDYQNNRVLNWSTLPSTHGAAANLVLGQNTFDSDVGNSGGLSASSLFKPYHVEAVADQLLVSDSSNNRILFWNAIPSSNKAAASAVYGQPDLESDASLMPPSADSLFVPTTVQLVFGGLVIADYKNDRVILRPWP
jgi:hypothetical protein